MLIIFFKNYSICVQFENQRFSNSRINKTGGFINCTILLLLVLLCKTNNNKILESKVRSTLDCTILIFSQSENIKDSRIK